MAAARSSQALRGRGFWAALALLATLVASPTAAPAQTLTDVLSNRASSGGAGKKLVVEANETVYDNDKNTVTLIGDVILYYDGRKLEGDRVIYNRTTRRVFAQGNAKLTEADGTVSYGDRFELTDDFKDGFIDRLLVVTKTNERFAAPRAERTEGERTVFERGTYTPCKPCEEHPEQPPLWQMRADKITHVNSEQTVYYENARLEFFGLPVGWIPFFSSPDPTVTRRTGFLTPSFVTSSALGSGPKIPFFWAIAPNIDVTIEPTILSRQGLLLTAEWRHRLENGQYTLRLAGIKQLDPNAFRGSPLGAADRNYRGSIESAGQFFINQKWSFGWDIAVSSDKYFFQNYKVRSDSLRTNIYGLKESISQLYLTGQSEKAFFDARAYYFRGLTYYDWQKQLPVAGPVVDYNRRGTLPVVGGEISLTTNFTRVQREQAAFTEIFPASVGAPARLISGVTTNGKNGVDGYALYDACTVYQAGRCILRGIAGEYDRFSTNVSWRRQYVDPVGQVWTPFFNGRVDLGYKSIDLGGPTITQPSTLSNTPSGPQYVQASYSNANQTNFIDTSNDTLARFMPTVGLEYRFPFIAATSWGTHVIEPIGQIVVRPDETKIGRFPNEDAQSLVFDDTSLFQWNKFSGFDRVEGGTRANVGVQYTARFNNGGYANVLFGQSYQLAGRNSFVNDVGHQDLANTGADSGLDKGASDYVGRVVVAPNPSLSFSARARFNGDNDLSLKRVDLVSTKSFDLAPYNSFVKAASVTALYTRILPQPDIGYDQRREGLSFTGSLYFQSNWFTTGSVQFDLSRHLYNEAVGIPDRSLFNVANYGLGVGYKDECTTFTVNYVSSYVDTVSGQRQRGDTFLFRLELKHLGDLNYKAGSGADTSTTAR